MNSVVLYAFGRAATKGEWYIDQSRIVSRLYFVNRGNAILRTAGGEERLTEGHFYILPRSDHFAPIATECFDHTYFDYYSTRILRPDRIIAFPLSRFGAEHFLRFINALLSEGTQEKTHRSVQALVQGFLALAEDALPHAAFIESIAVARAVERIQKDFSFVSTRELAAEAHLDESYFIRLFKESVGLSPLQYIRARRVLHGRQLLESGYSVEAAAEACGYITPSAFYKAVRAETKKSPSALKG